MKKQLLAALLIFSWAAHSQKEVELNKQGIEYAENGDLKKAFELFNQAIAANPKFSNGYSNRGQVYRQKHDYDMAIADFTKSLELYPDNLDVLYARADVYMDTNNFAKATADYTTIINRKPTFANIYFDRGFAYIRQEKYEEAKKDMENQIALDPKDFKSLANLINIKKHLKMNQEALIDYEKLLKQFPNENNLHIVYNNRASLYMELHEFEKALTDTNKAIALKDDYDMGYLNRAEIYDKMGNKKKACEDFNKAQQLKVESNKFFVSDADYLSVKKLCN